MILIAPEAFATVNDTLMSDLPPLSAQLNAVLCAFLREHELPPDCVKFTPAIDTRLGFAEMQISNVACSSIIEERGLSVALMDRLGVVWVPFVEEHIRRTAAEVARLDSVDSLRLAFHAPFVGDAHRLVYERILQCARHHHSSPGSFLYPYLCVVQSKGLGKSRRLYELATTVSTDVNQDQHQRMHVVYASTMLQDSDARYPVVPRDLSLHLFPMEWRFGDEQEQIDKLAVKRVDTFAYVMESECWQSMSSTLEKLFDGDDEDFVDALEARATAPGSPSKQPRAPDDQTRLWIVAADDARRLLSNDGNSDGFRVLRSALRAASCTIADTYGPSSMLIAVLADSDPAIATRTPQQNSRQLLGFGPVVHNDAMDIVPPGESDDYASMYRAQVVAAVHVRYSNDSSWRRLLGYCRPLWRAIDHKQDKSAQDPARIAACRLMGATSAKLKLWTCGNNLGGVAALLCRTGVRPRSTTHLPNRLFADHMAVLARIGGARDQVFCIYSSDSILAMRATMLWHRPPARVPHVATLVSTHMLPKLRALLVEESVEVRDVSTLVARIVLLLTTSPQHNAGDLEVAARG